MFKQLRQRASGFAIGFLLACLIIGQTAHASYAPSIVKSVQYGTATYVSGATSTTATITGVTVAKAAVVYLGDNVPVGGGGTGQIVNLSSITLTNTTTVTATRTSGTNSGASNIAGTVNFVVVEFY